MTSFAIRCLLIVIHQIESLQMLIVTILADHFRSRIVCQFDHRLIVSYKNTQMHLVR